VQNYVGKAHNALLKWFSEAWLQKGPPVCFLEGFSGTGKTALARQLMSNTSRALKAVLVNIPESDFVSIDDLLLNLATELSIVGRKELADAVNTGSSLLAVLEDILSSKVLIIVDDVQRALRTGSGRPIEVVGRMLERMGNRPASPGRLLLISNRLVDRGRWSEPHEIRSLPGLTAEEAELLLDSLVSAAGRSDEVPVERRRDVVNWLGRNPRAMRVLAASLQHDSLDDLIGLDPQSWELRDRDVSPELLQRLEEELLERTLSRINPETETFFLQLSVHRKSVQSKALESVAASLGDFARLRDNLIGCFLLEQHGGWFSLNPVGREIALQRLRNTPSVLRCAHSLAADYYRRHFVAKNIAGRAGHLGGYFVEARYHLVQAGREADLGPIAMRFRNYIRGSIHGVTPIPDNQSEVAGQIAMLSALLESPGPKELEYYLARLFNFRGSHQDLQSALVHARRATAPHMDVAVWQLRVELEWELNGDREGLRIAREAIDYIPAGKNIAALYRRCGELLAESGRVGEAIELLMEGIDRIPVGSNIAPLYQGCARLMAKSGRLDEGIWLLESGARSVPANKNLVFLYQSWGELLAGSGSVGKAIEVLMAGMRAIPVGKWNQYRLAEQVLYLCVATEDRDKLGEILAGRSAAYLTAESALLGKVLDLQMQEAWKEAAEVAHMGLVRAPNNLSLVMQEAFSWLCAGHPQLAENAFLHFKTRDKVTKGTAFAWLRAFVHMRLGSTSSAQDIISGHLGRPLRDSEQFNEGFLLRLWDESADLSQDANTAHYFPILPPSITGLSAPLARPPFGPSVLPQAGSNLRPESITSNAKVVLAVATEWQSSNGGVSTFNRELCIGLSSAGYRVYCLVPGASSEEAESAKKGGVELVRPPSSPGLDQRALLLLRPELPAGIIPDLIIGHDRVTGPAAYALKSNHFRQSLLIQVIHTAPGEIEWYKDHATGPSAAVTAEEREIIQTDLAGNADLVVAVGPLLYREMSTSLVASSKPVMQLNPGIGEPVATRQIPLSVECLVLGRTDDLDLKGLDIAARAMGLLTDGLFALEPRLVIRGASLGTGDQLRAQLLEVSGRPGVKINVKEYTENTTRLADDLLRASVVLMPSRAEGFGLVGLEAIAAGTPVLISDQSGLGELIRSQVPEMAGNCVIRVTTDLERDAQEWAKNIEFVLKDRAASFERAAVLRRRLGASLSWPITAARLAEAIAQAEH
jgi:glycosyltransferase involved in cell wall biosynthesis/tetratricopeptide (TPR) repeat protein